MWFVWGRNYLIVDDDRIRGRTFISRHAYRWDEIAKVVWMDDVLGQRAWVHVWLTGAHPINPGVTVCTIVPIGLLSERKRLAAEFKRCCEGRGVEVRQLRNQGPICEADAEGALTMAGERRDLLRQSNDG